MILLVLLLAIGANGLSDSHTKHLNDTFSYYSDLLSSTHDSFETAMENKNVFGTCDFYRACPDNINFGTYQDYFSPDPSFNNYAINVSHSTFKQLPGDTLTTKQEQEICAIRSVENVWQHNLIVPERTETKWQYFATEDGLFSLFPATDWTTVNQCPGTYDPRIRPWYVTGSTGQKNMVIMIEKSTKLPGSSQRIDMSKKLANLFLDTLSFTDYVNVVVYDEFSTFYSNMLVQATSENINSIKANVDVISSTGPTRESNVGMALRNTFDMIDLSISEESSSGCHNIIIMLMSGGNDITEVDVAKEIRKAENDPIIIPYIVHPGNDDPPVLTPTIISCNGNGYTMKVDSDSQLVSAVESFANYLSSGVRVTVPKFSEIYTDAFQQGSLTTAALPTYHIDGNGVSSVTGMVAIDISATDVSINGEISNSEIESFILSNQQCEGLKIPQPVRNHLQDPAECDALTTTTVTEEPDVVRRKPGIIAGTILGSFIVFTFIPMAWYAYVMGKEDDSSDGIGSKGAMANLKCGLLGIGIVAWIWFWATFYAGLWDDMIKVNYWERTDIITETRNVHEYRCAEVVGCSCTQFSGRSCANARHYLIQPTTPETRLSCGGGYQCCNWYYYECNCYWYTDCYTSGYGQHSYTTCTQRRRCSTCRECTRSVSNKKCTAVRGTCRDITIRVSFYNEKTDETVFTSKVQSCGRDDMKCVNDFDAQYMPIGRKQERYFNPANPDEMETTVGYRTGMWVCLAFPALYLSCVYLFIIGHFLYTMLPKLWKKISNIENPCKGCCDSCISPSECLRRVDCNCCDCLDCNSCKDGSESNGKDMGKHTRSTEYTNEAYTGTIQQPQPVQPTFSQGYGQPPAYPPAYGNHSAMYPPPITYGQAPDSYV